MPGRSLSVIISGKPFAGVADFRLKPFEKTHQMPISVDPVPALPPYTQVRDILLHSIYVASAAQKCFAEMAAMSFRAHSTGLRDCNARGKSALWDMVLDLTCDLQRGPILPLIRLQGIQQTGHIRRKRAFKLK